MGKNLADNGAAEPRARARATAKLGHVQAFSDSLHGLAPSSRARTLAATKSLLSLCQRVGKGLDVAVGDPGQRAATNARNWSPSSTVGALGVRPAAVEPHFDQPLIGPAPAPAPPAEPAAVPVAAVVALNLLGNGLEQTIECQDRRIDLLGNDNPTHAHGHLHTVTWQNGPQDNGTVLGADSSVAHEVLPQGRTLDWRRPVPCVSQGKPRGADHVAEGMASPDCR